jgi:hypothetical protein
VDFAAATAANWFSPMGFLNRLASRARYRIHTGLDGIEDMVDIHDMDMIRLEKDYAGKWVALDPDGDTVMASGESASIVYQAAQRIGIQSPMVLWVLDNYGGLARCQR